MIRKNCIYRKSAKGTEAIATRQHGLAPKLRSMLILIDGKRGFDELARLSQALGEPEQLVEHLLEHGFIEESPVPKEAPAPSIRAPIAAPAGGSTVSLREAQRFAARRLTDLLGPNAETLCLRIEAARNAKDYHAAITQAQEIVREFRGAQAASDFAAVLETHRPDGLPDIHL